MSDFWKRIKIKLHVKIKVRIGRIIEHEWPPHLIPSLHQLWRDIVSRRYWGEKHLQTHEVEGKETTIITKMKIKSDTRDPNVGSHNTLRWTRLGRESCKNMLINSSRKLAWNTYILWRIQHWLMSRNYAVFKKGLSTSLMDTSIWKTQYKIWLIKEDLVHMSRNKQEKGTTRYIRILQVNMFGKMNPAYKVF